MAHDKRLRRYEERTSSGRNGVAHWACVVGACALTLLAPALGGQPAPNVVEWGDISLFSVPADATNVVVASVGRGATVIRADGTLVIWGVFAGAPNPPSGLTNALAVSVGPGYGLAVSNGTVVVWGADEIMNVYDVPPGLTNAVAVAAGAGPCLALRSDHTVAVWGDTAPPGLTNAVAVAAGQYYALALRSDGTVFAWGNDYYDYGVTTVPPGLTNVAAIAAGAYFNMALLADGALVAWGDNTYGQTNVPPNLTNVVAIAAGGFHCLALRSDGTVVAWGDDSNRQTSIPAGLTNVVSIAAGCLNSMAVTGPAMPPRQVPVTNVAFGAGGFSAQVPTDRGSVYALEYKSSLSDARWTLLPLVAGTGGAVELSDAAPGPSQRFYRVRRW